MGQVFRATDTKLKRQVAIKILPPALGDDADRLARFQREAEVLASLNHPNVAAIYGIEESHDVRAIVMEFVEGDDLSQRIARGAIPLEEALSIAKQIAGALDAAHERGIIHRDLKPANIKVRPDGAVKVLDFGLAKALEPMLGSPTSESMSATITTPAMTQAGMILGTAAYMSPEQARGKTVDRRADIWAFGCVLYEMLTARRTFAGDEVSDVLASVLARDPDLAALPANTPPSIWRLLRRCLEKDRNERLRDIGDAGIEIRDALARADPEESVVGTSGAVLYRQRLAWIGPLVALTIVLGTSLILALRRTPGASEMRVDISTPLTTAPLSLAISPDGQTIAFVATADGQSRLWLRSLVTGSAQPVKGTDGAEFPFWSPDSRSIGFFAEGKLSRLDVDGGSVRTLAPAPGGRSGTWNREGVILFASLGTPIARVPATGGEPVPLSGLAQEGSDFTPQFLPDGRRFLYYVRGSPEKRGVYVGQLDERLDARRLLDSDTGAAYASSGHLLFVLQGTLFAQQFDPIRLELTGNPFPLAEHAASGPGALPSVSDAGSIAFRTSSAGEKRQFVWFDRSGKELGHVGDSVSTVLQSPSLSLDGLRAALYRTVDGNVDIWLLETKRGVFSRFTSDAADDVMPVWSPHGDRIVFSSNRKGTHDLYQKSVIGGGQEELVLSTAETKFASDWSANGYFLLFTSQNPKRNGDIWALRLDGKGKPFPVVQTAADEQRGQFSPDGNWIAYQSNESGRPEIYVQPFPGPGSKWPISINGGSQVRWRRDEKELFYVALDGRLMAVSFRAASNAQVPEVGAPVALFVPLLGGAVQKGDYRHQYMVSADRSQFLVATIKEEANSPIMVILNWKPRR